MIPVRPLKFGLMKKNYLLMFCLLMPAITAPAQTLRFSQYTFNGLSLNPAYAGYKESWYCNAAYRHQWTDMPGAPRTGAVSIDGTPNTPGKRLGLGLQCAFDKLGPQQTLSMYGSYAYRIPLDENGNKRICFGIGAGLTQYSLDGGALQYNHDNDEIIPLIRLRRLVPDFRFGIYYYSPRYYAGISVMDLLSGYMDGPRYNWRGNDYAAISKTRHYYLTAGARWPLSAQVSLKPSFLLKEDFNNPTQLDLNAAVLIKELLWIGASWRTAVRLWDQAQLPRNLSQQDAVCFMIEIYASKTMRLGYAYDYTLNGLASYEKGSHEISLGYTLGKINMRTLQKYF
jgi:type IX secretion system PorP/SprF family membrane protein